MKRPLIPLAVTTLAVATLSVLLPAAPASAHPLGNFSVNTYAELTVHPDRLDALVAADIAELPTLQDPPATCDEATRAFTVTAAGSPVVWAVTSSALTYAAGAGGLRTSRLECRLTGPAALGAVEVANRFRDDRIGWREMVANAGPGAALTGSPLPVAGISDELRTYPSDLLTTPPDVRTASFSTAAGTGSAAAAPPAASGPGSPSASGGPLAGAERYLQDLVGDREITPWVGMVGVLLALLLGAGHAALPGHGKTVMAAYLAGRRGRPRDAVAVGATVTVTHTGGVLVLGLVLTTVAGIAGETILGYLGVASGLIVATIGAGALIGALRKRATGHRHHSHNHNHDHDHGHDHGHSHGPGRWSLAGMGIAGGLVPSPSALIVLLGAAALGRTVFGVLLVLAYGAGMAATLTAAGLLLIRIRDRLEGRLTHLRRWRTAVPPITAALILIVGAGLVGRGLVTLTLT
ncbi:hypothetical protein [Actinoplanes sp. NBRC 103695]|uniref:hypothetical protein n=1 Tax=Actinoplanes sp. NBRC 103695 TaxID=3032202 RepID=UPI0024A0CC6C|nr:hypothetical protein [Actinoplanes sp. NBRC 103695]GLY92852.1 hypothetical protein Acsp02_01080 [Actinoplanes sp. NBRC 103695]